MSAPASGHYAFVESNTTGTGRLAVERLLRRGCTVTFLARQPEKYPFLESPRPGLDVAVVETNELHTVMARLGEIHRRQPIDVVLTFSEYYIPTVAEVAARFAFRYLDPAVARRCRNKHQTRRALAAAGLPTPVSHAVSSFAEALAVSRQMTYPCIVKPPEESSSAGVRQVGDAAALLAHFEVLHGWRENARGQRMDGVVLVESLLDGPEVSVETVTLAAGETRIVGITQKHLSPPPLFVELGHDFPAELAPRQTAEIERATRAALDAVGYDFGPAHTELRLTHRGPVVVEINPRLAGGMIPELVLHATGIDLLEALLDQLAGKAIDLEPKRRDFAAIRFLTAPRAGLWTAVHGIDEARGLPSVQEVSLNKKLGMPVRPAEEATGRLGQVITAGGDRRQVLTEVEAAIGRLRVEVAPPVEISTPAVVSEISP